MTGAAPIVGPGLLVPVVVVAELLNVPVTERAASITMTQVLEPVQAPDHPANLEPVPAIAVKLTEAPDVSDAEHVVPQLIPLGLLVTVPDPLPALLTVKEYEPVEKTVNAAVTLRAALRVTVQVPVPVQSPDQPPNLEPLDAAAVKTTCVPVLKVAEHVEPQLIPEGLLVTVPLPVPVFMTVNVFVVGLAFRQPDASMAARFANILF